MTNWSFCNYKENFTSDHNYGASTCIHDEQNTRLTERQDKQLGVINGELYARMIECLLFPRTIFFLYFKVTGFETPVYKANNCKDVGIFSFTQERICLHQKDKLISSRKSGGGAAVQQFLQKLKVASFGVPAVQIP